MRKRKTTRRTALIAGGIVVLGALGDIGCLAQSPTPKPPIKSKPGVAPMVETAEKLRARVVSWDVGFKPPTEKEWIDRVREEVADAAAERIDVLVFPELFAAGLGPYTPKGERQAEFVTRRMNDAVLPSVKREVAGRSMLVALGSYWHQESGWNYALNRAPVLIDGTLHFVDKLHPTPGELIGDPPPTIKPGGILPLFPFRGGTAAVVICFSLEMPEVSAALKEEGVQLVLGPSATEDEDGVARVLRASAAREPSSSGRRFSWRRSWAPKRAWKNLGSAALYLPAQKGIDHRPQESVRRKDRIAHDDFVIPWKALLDLREQPPKPETRPFLFPVAPVCTERKG